MTNPNKKQPYKNSNTGTNPIGNLVRQAQNRLESTVSTSDHNEAVLQQSQVWVKAVTWGLIGTTVFGVAWLGIARTEEVVVATGKLEPVGNVKEVRVPGGAVVEEILVKNGERVSEGQALILLDQESTAEQLKSLEQGVIEKTSQINQKQAQLSLKNLERERTFELNREQLATTRENLRLETQILNRLEGLAKEGGIPDIQYLQQRNKVAGLKGANVEDTAGKSFPVRIIQAVPKDSEDVELNDALIPGSGKRAQQLKFLKRFAEKLKPKLSEQPTGEMSFAGATHFL